MPINVLPKDTPRGRGPEPSQALSEKQKEELVEGEEKLKESDLADQETKPSGNPRNWPHQLVRRRR